jgi:hypothetical protein
MSSFKIVNRCNEWVQAPAGRSGHRCGNIARYAVDMPTGTKHVCGIHVKWYNGVGVRELESR